MSQTGKDPADRFSIDPASVAAYREQLREMAEGTPVALAAIDGFTDWQVVEAMERLWKAGTEELEVAGEAQAAARRRSRSSHQSTA